MDERHITVGKTARYYTLGRTGPSARAVWFVCHGYGQLAGRFLEKLRVLDDGMRYLVAPEALSRFYLEDVAVPAKRRKVGATWMTREDRLREIEDYVRYLDALYAEVFRSIARPRVRVTALGFSQGAATVSRWATLGTSQVDHVVLWGGELPPDLDLGAARGRLHGVPFTLVYGERDDYITRKLVDGMAARLREHDISHSVRPFDGGHELDDATLKELAR